MWAIRVHFDKNSFQIQDELVSGGIKINSDSIILTREQCKTYGRGNKQTDWKTSPLEFMYYLPLGLFRWKFVYTEHVTSVYKSVV